MGMDSKKLSARLKQPGHDRTFRASETNFVKALGMLLPKDEWIIRDHPGDLRQLISGRYGVVPEASIEYRPTGRKVYFEVKKQGPAGNADERACKHHTVQFYAVMRAHTGYSYHPFVTIMCDSLATDERYTTKHPAYFEPDQYFCWVDYDLDALSAFIEKLRQQWLAKK
ncbi:MAG: hypothetical protein BWX84_00006 [Verrucomicrobia bacterium ADurb.Bin118]|nr:MAG: hypothetical protein BWX84_00006 [Verrucomicrobia bacterium ADurb.Bin118]